MKKIVIEGQNCLSGTVEIQGAKNAAQMALTLGSQKRYTEAYEAYQRTPENWCAEPQIKLLAKNVFRQVPGKDVT